MHLLSCIVFYFTFLIVCLVRKVLMALRTKPHILEATCPFILGIASCALFSVYNARKWLAAMRYSLPNGSNHRPIDRWQLVPHLAWLVLGVGGGNTCQLWGLLPIEFETCFGFYKSTGWLDNLPNEIKRPHTHTHTHTLWPWVVIQYVWECCSCFVGAHSALWCTIEIDYWYWHSWLSPSATAPISHSKYNAPSHGSCLILASLLNCRPHVCQTHRQTVCVRQLLYHHHLHCHQVHRHQHDNVWIISGKSFSFPRIFSLS